MADIIDQNIFPSGWECKFDKKTGKNYFINHLTKTTTWEDPRYRHKSNQFHQQYVGDGIIHQPSPYHVYPYPSQLPPQHAFQPPPYLTTYSPKAIPRQILQEMGGKSYHGSPLSGGSPVLGRTLSLTPKGSPMIGRISSASIHKPHDSPITLATDTEALVAKISTMFPTVSETHIKILLKKYYNREAVVISALQVEKHPISTPGPYSTPPAGQSRLANIAAMVMGNGSSPPLFGGSPRASPPLRPQSGASGTLAGSPRSFSKPHSPKMKLRYLKSNFPKAEETLILDVLASEDNNVLKSAEKLQGMGYAKKDALGSRLSIPNKEADLPKNAPPPPPPPVTPPRLMSIEDKQSLKEKLRKKYSTIPERVVSIALESVDWSEDRAEQILSVVLQEDAVSKKPKDLIKEKETPTDAKQDLSTCKVIAALPTPSPVQAVDVLSKWKLSREPNHLDKVNRRYKNKKETTKIVTHSSPENERTYISQFAVDAKGPNQELPKGAQDKILLIDYVPWNGANPELKSGSTVLPKGSIKAKDSCVDNIYGVQARGPNKDICKGPASLAKGSIYKHLKKANNLTQMKVGGE